MPQAGTFALVALGIAQQCYLGEESFANNVAQSSL